jgi:hypothetical protein
MAWRFRKSKNIGPFRATVSKKGIGTSFGFLGFRFGVSPDGKKFWSFVHPVDYNDLIKFLKIHIIFCFPSFYVLIIF